MKQFLLILLGLLIISVPAPAPADTNAAVRLSPESFGQCQFSIMETEHIKLETLSDGSSEYSYCQISLSIPPDLSGEPLDLAILDRGLHESEIRSKMNAGATENGFVLETNGKRLFLGTDFLLPPTKMLSASLVEERREGEEILVGHQLLRGYISQGGPLKVPGIRILRMTPIFSVRASLNFHSIDREQITQRRLREAVGKELVDVIKSVQYRPGVKGPTVRSDQGGRP